jgi:transglutaminase-like putative cysteine protease
MKDNLSSYLQPGRFVDSGHPKVIEFARLNSQGADAREKAVSLYYAVRDGIRYNPFQNFTADESYRASACLERRVGWCVSKAALLAAAARVVEIPARVAFADVKNHLTTPELTAKMGTDLFVYHGLVELHLDGKWIKATPVFNLSLCTRFRVKPLDFDGRSDSIFHPFDQDNRRHMEYVRERGAHTDVPAEDIKRVFSETYPQLFNLGSAATRREFV